MSNRLLRHALLVVAAVATVAVAATPSVASASTPKPADDPASTGYIEICKTFAADPNGGPAYQGTFSYQISDSGTTDTVTINAVEGGPQSCTAPIAVPAGTATVTETSAPWFSVASITATPGDPGTVTTDSPGVATLTVNPAPSAGDESLTTTVQYANDPVDGTVEICKQADSGSPTLSGTYSFDLTSTDAGVSAYDANTGAYDLPWTTTTSATISAAGLGCSGPIIVPAGTVQTVEPGTTYVTGITASSNGTNELTDPAPDLTSGTANANVPAGDTTNQTIVTYTDALSTVKLCKMWTGNNTPTRPYGFTVTSSGPDGPTAVTGSVSLAPGGCQILGEVRAGTQVNITEAAVAGTKVASIGVSPTTNSQGASPIVPSSLSLPNRTVSVIAGAGETDVTFTNEAADPGQLKICVAPTTNPAAGMVPFLVNGSQVIDVNLSSTAVQCTLDPSTFAFDGAVTLAGGSLPTGDSYTGTATAVPASVEVLEGGVPTLTNQSTISSGTASTATVMMSEGIVTEVTFMVDPPARATGSPVTTDPTIGQVLAESADLPSVTPASKTAKPAEVSAIVRRQLTRVRAEIRTLTKKLSSKHLSRAARRADRRKLAALRRLEPRLLKELRG